MESCKHQPRLTAELELLQESAFIEGDRSEIKQGNFVPLSWIFFLRNHHPAQSLPTNYWH